MPEERKAQADEEGAEDERVEYKFVDLRKNVRRVFCISLEDAKRS